MAAQNSCPHCGQSINTDERICPHCGINVAVATALAFEILTTREETFANMPCSPEILVSRIGEVFLEQGLLSQEQLQTALEYQKAWNAKGMAILLGQALLELNFVDRPTLDRVVTLQILKLHSALHQANFQLTQQVKEISTAYQKALEQITQLNQVKSNFLAAISHELRTPLTGIKGYLDILTQGDLGPVTTAQQEILANLNKAETSLEILIEDLINFSLASQGQLNLKYQPVNIGNLIISCIQFSQEKARKKNIRLTYDTAVDLPAVLADGQKIEWVILQLLDNAIKFTPNGGAVSISAIHCGAYATVKVADTGIGIAADQLEAIFNSFYQIEGSDTRRFSGTGLGLALARKIIEAHLSQIVIHSVVGEGSQFEFSLPVSSKDDDVKYPIH